MADLTITAANVVAGARAKIEQSVAGAPITAGQVVYRDAATRKLGLADSNSATPAVRVPFGISLNGGALNQPIAVVTEGPVTIGAALVAGAAYYLSETPGGLQPAADLGSGEYTSIIGIATSATVLNVDIQSSGVALA